MVDINPRLKKLIFEKIDSDLSDVIFHPYGKEIWLVTLEDKGWYFVGNSEGTTWFNQKFFDNFFRLFSMNSKEYSPIIKEWFELKTSVRIRQFARRNTNYDYMIEGILKRSQKDYDWSISKRWGFSYPLVKRYVEMKESLQTENLKLKDL
jgi:hypothetical protein